MQPYRAIDPSDLNHFRSILGEAFVCTDQDALEQYGRDETEDLCFPPEVVLKPGNANEIAAILRHCNESGIPVTARAAGSGLAGGALPVRAGVSLSLERLNQILEIDERNLQLTVEPGVITEVLQDAVKEKGLFYPPDPASKGMCFIGGNVANNSGGPKAVKYGVVKDYVLNLEVVLANGEIIWTGANVLKNSTGYNLTQLMVGSEGTLGIVSKIVLRLIPHPKYDLVMLAAFKDAGKACEAVSAIFRSGITPSGLEFMERDAIEWSMDYLGESPISVADDVKAHLLIEVDGNDMELLQQDCVAINEVLEGFEVADVLFADSEAQKAALWQLRRNVAHAVKTQSIYKEEDTVVPRAELPKLLAQVKEVGNRYGFQSVCYGHAGDGNLHVNIIKGDMSDRDWEEKLPLGINEIFRAVVDLGGTLSGEHGIGWVQKNYMPIAFSETQMNLMRGIKTIFDPNNILNPDKIFPDEKA